MLPLYARAGIAETWLLDLGTDGVEVYRCPGAGGYAETRSLTRGDDVAPGAFPDIRLALRDLLG